jgi:hypothetical protein
MGKIAKGAWLLGFVPLGGCGGLDMRFLGRKWQKKKADSLPDDKKDNGNRSVASPVESVAG